jgi:hypothetical protein
VDLIKALNVILDHAAIGVAQSKGKDLELNQALIVVTEKLGAFLDPSKEVQDGDH